MCPGPGRGSADQPRSVVRDRRARRCPRRRAGVTAKPVPSGVWAKTLSMSTSSRSARSLADTGTTRGPVATSTLERTPVVLGERRPEGDPAGDRGRRVAAGGEGALHRAPGLLDDLVDGQLEHGDVVLQPLRHRGVVDRLGVQAQRRHRRTQPVREVADGGALGGEELAGALGETVQRPGELLGLRGAADLGAGGEVALAELVRGLRHLAQRLADPAPELAGDHPAERRAARGRGR